MIGSGLRFCKVQGAGNDFVVLDRREDPTPLSAELIAFLADRRHGVGFDQLLTIEPPSSSPTVLSYGIWNTDGTKAAQCGNGARCVAAWAWRHGMSRQSSFWMDSPSGPVQVWIHAAADIEVSLSQPAFAAANLPPERAIEPAMPWQKYLPVSMGNPHAVIEVPRVDDAPVAEWGAALQASGEFPEGVNVGFVELVDRRRVRLRVFERGVGETLACGSGACAAVAAMRRDGRVDACVDVHLRGGTLRINWPGVGHPVHMRGPALFVFEGELCA